MTTSGGAFLDGVRVLDLTTALSGPYCTSVLVDLGADVISVEQVDGDPMRDRRSPRDGISYPFEMVHHDKRSVAVDIRDPRVSAALLRLAGTVDVVVENFRPGVLARRGLDAASMRAAYPQLIYCSISGYGQTGPMGERGGVDLVAQGHAALMSVTGPAGGPPAKAGFPVSDVGAGMWAAIGILGALARRHATGEGATIDVALTDGVFAWAVWEVADYQMTGIVPQALGTAHRLTAPYQGFRCGDGKWIVFAGLPSRWPQLCEELGLAALSTDERFASESGRYRHRDELAELITGALAGRTRDEWLRRLHAAGIPAGPINDIADAMADEQFAAREMIRSVRVDGTMVSVLNSPIRADGCVGVRRPAPRVGADTRDVLAAVGLDDATLAEWRAEGIIADARDPQEQ
jgi:crotonobetainyl-CoA:carnitine CoA-transferase CaiB-like acyl-CoA transferase